MQRNSFFESDTKRFIVAVEASLEQRNTTLIDYKIDTDGESPVIKIALIGDPISDDLRNTWIRMRSDYGLEKVELDIREPRDFSKVRGERRTRPLKRSAKSRRSARLTSCKTTTNVSWPDATLPLHRSTRALAKRPCSAATLISWAPS